MVKANENAKSERSKTNDNCDDQRSGRPEWDDYWSEIAEAIKKRSSDPDCQVGAVIVKANVLLSTGYNGFARDVQHLARRLQKQDDEKLRWMCHAEQNAIYNAARVGASIEGATIYTTKFPCLYCTNAIVQTGIQAIYTTDTKPYNDSILGDHGERVIHVLSETNVRIEAPNCDLYLSTVSAGSGRHQSNGRSSNGKGRKTRK